MKNRVLGGVMERELLLHHRDRQFAYQEWIRSVTDLT